MSSSAVRVALAFIATVPARVAAAEDFSSVPRPSAPIALPDVLQVALRQSPTLTRAVIDIDLARADMRAAAGLDDFTLSAIAGFSIARQWQTVGTPGIAVTQDAGLDVGLARALRTGGHVSATGSAHRLHATFHPDGMPEVAGFSGLATELSGRAMHPLMRGFGERIARADQRRAAIAHDVATLQQSVEALKIVREAIVAYWQVGYALEIMRIRRASLALAIDQLAITQRAVRSGSVSPTETLAAEQAIAVREQALLQAQVELSKQSLELRRLVGLELARHQIDVTPTTPLAVPSGGFDLDATIQRAFDHSPLIAILQTRVKSADVDIEVAADAIRPRLDVLATISSTGRAGSVSQSIQQLATLANPQFSVMLEYEQQLGARAAKGAHERARSLKRRARVELAEAHRELVVSITHTIDLVRAAQQRIAVGDRAIVLAQRNIEIEQTRFLNGKATNFDVLLRQEELQQANAARALAITDALAAEATIEALTGDLLDRHHIRIVPGK